MSAADTTRADARRSRPLGAQGFIEPSTCVGLYLVLFAGGLGLPIPEEVAIMAGGVLARDPRPAACTPHALTSNDVGRFEQRRAAAMPDGGHRAFTLVRDSPAAAGAARWAVLLGDDALPRPMHLRQRGTRCAGAG